MYRYRICVGCGQRWNVSAVGKSEKKYICPKCEYRQNKKRSEKERLRRKSRRMKPAED